jgi:hypothetical protein
MSVMIINPSQSSGDYIYDLLTLIFPGVHLQFFTVLKIKADYFLKQHQPVDLYMVKCCVFFEVRAGFLNSI